MVLLISFVSTLVLTFQIKAPVTEEIAYRSCILSIYKLAGYNKSHMIWFGPLWFGLGTNNIISYNSQLNFLSLAHVHHAFEVYLRLGRNAAALRTALISSCKDLGRE